MPFGIIDYYRMLKSRGYKFPLCYFFENHYFDIINKTDTHKRIDKSAYSDIPKNFEHGVLYMSSWTSVIRRTSKIILKLTETKSTYFVDVGCGKGKVLCVWSQCLPDQQIYLMGIEYSKDLFNIAKNNLKILAIDNCLLINSDICDVDFGSNNEDVCYVFYLFNPFGSKVMQNFIQKIKLLDCFIIYNNPIHRHLFTQFEKVYEEKGWHPNLEFIIYRNKV